jgi:hypothetical protein
MREGRSRLRSNESGTRKREEEESPVPDICV